MWQADSDTSLQSDKSHHLTTEYLQSRAQSVKQQRFHGGYFSFPGARSIPGSRGLRFVNGRLQMGAPERPPVHTVMTAQAYAASVRKYLTATAPLEKKKKRPKSVSPQRDPRDVLVHSRKAALASVAHYGRLKKHQPKSGPRILTQPTPPPDGLPAGSSEDAHSVATSAPHEGAEAASSAGGPESPSPGGDAQDTFWAFPPNEAQQSDAHRAQQLRLRQQTQLERLQMQLYDQLSVQLRQELDKRYPPRPKSKKSSRGGSRGEPGGTLRAKPDKPLRSAMARRQTGASKSPPRRVALSLEPDLALDPSVVSGSVSGALLSREERENAIEQERRSRLMKARQGRIDRVRHIRAQQRTQAQQLNLPHIAWAEQAQKQKDKARLQAVLEQQRLENPHFAILKSSHAISNPHTAELEANMADINDQLNEFEQRLLKMEVLSDDYYEI